MRILYFSEHYEADSFISRQVDEISSDVDCHYMCLTADPLADSERKSKIHFLQRKESKWLRRLKQRLEFSDIYINYFNSTFAKSVRKLVEELRPDIIHCQYGYDAVKLLDNYYDPRQKYVITFRGFDASLQLILSKFVKKLVNYLARPNVYCVFVCNNLRQNLLDKGISLNPLNMVLYSNTDTDFYKRNTYELPHSPRIFIQVSNFREKKGHYYTLLAFDEFKRRHPHRDFIVCFVGSKTVEYETLLRQTAHLKVMENVQFTGKKNKEEIKDLLEKSHVFVHNSITSRHNDQEGIPNAIMEAMSMEMPILATRHSGIPELLERGEDVLLAEEKNVDEYVKNIEEIFDRPLSARNRERIVAAFSKGRFRIDILNFYKKILSS